VCFGVFVLPESLDRQKRRKITAGRANPFKLLVGQIVREQGVWRLAVAWSCSWVGLGAVQSSLVLFTGYCFGWGPKINGLVLAGVGLSQALAEGALLKFVTARLGARRTAVMAYVCAALGYGALAFAFAGWTLVPAIALMALGGMATPSVRSMVSSIGGDQNQGEMQGLLSSVEGLTAIVAPLAAAGLFYAFTSHVLPVAFPGAPFALASATAMIACVLLSGWRADEPVAPVEARRPEASWTSK